ncbi:MAG TPA: hypothetical protein VK154_06670 [Chitinophagales bacterium]|nr:hypothetical protein [Chitinophagales bacterium]
MKYITLLLLVFALAACNQKKIINAPNDQFQLSDIPLHKGMSVTLFVGDELEGQEPYRDTVIMDYIAEGISRNGYDNLVCNVIRKENPGDIVYPTYYYAADSLYLVLTSGVDTTRFDIDHELHLPLFVGKKWASKNGYNHYAVVDNNASYAGYDGLFEVRCTAISKAKPNLMSRYCYKKGMGCVYHEYIEDTLQPKQARLFSHVIKVEGK